MAFTGINGNMGINRMGDPSIIYKRKFRWTFAVTPLCSGLQPIDPFFVKVASRPKIGIEETELNFLNEKMWIPGKVTYEAMTVTYIDVAAKEPASAALYAWLGAIYQFNNPNRKMGSSLSQYGATGVLQLYDPCGTPVERWDYNDLWVNNMDFGDLDNSSSDTMDITLSLRFTKFTYTSLCGSINFPTCCAGC